MQSVVCLQLLPPKCLRKLYHRTSSIVNCNYPGSINEKTETLETEVLPRLAAHGNVSLALPPPNLLSQQLDHAADEECGSANSLQGPSRAFNKQFK